MIQITTLAPLVYLFTTFYFKEQITGNPQYSWIVDVANAIIEVMPSSVFTDDDDYLDVFYTVEKNRAYTDYYGVSTNAKISLIPYRLPPNE